MAKKKKRSTVYLQYQCKDGSVTVSASASLGLMYWYGRLIPTPRLEHPPQVPTIQVTQVPVPSPYSKRFFPLVLAGLERTFGTAPAIPEHLLGDDFHESLPDDLSFGAVAEHLKKGTPQIVEYEQVCLDVLTWLKERGEIVKLLFNEPIQPLGW